jgi:hypothetical protein
MLGTETPFGDDELVLLIRKLAEIPAKNDMLAMFN